jgi:nicotinate-nucleotide adenylyltransferase
MRVALFGGTFDPPHRGHLAIAKEAADRFSLDQVLFAPAGRQPLKAHLAASSFADRLAMCALACGEDARFFASDLDCPRPDGTPNYTVETLENLQGNLPEAELFNLVGADSFHDLARWHEPRRLLRIASWIVVSRPGYLLAEPPGLTLSPSERSRIHLLDSVHEDIAATTLRERLAEGDICEDLLTEPVFAYIRAHHLY